ncbi:MAG: glycosyltransferase 61 family protein [Geitlerinemataceae cyanobacterium]
MMENTDLDRILQQASYHLEQGDYQNSIVLYEKSIELQPKTASHYWYLGLSYLLQGDELEAQSIWVSPFIEKSPEDFAAGMAELLAFLQEKADRYLNTHQAEIAEMIYWQILEIDADNFEVYTNLGKALSEQSRYDEAIFCWKKAIELEPRQLEAYQLQGEVFDKLEQFEDAISCYTQALEIERTSKIFYHCGLCYLHLNQVERSIECFKQLIQIQPTFAPAYSDLGYAFSQISKPDEAIAYFDKALQIEFRFATAYLASVDTKINQDCLSFDGIANRLLSQVNYERSSQVQTTTKSIEIGKDVEPERVTTDRKETYTETPQGFYETTRDWSVSSALENTHYITVFDNNKINLKSPKTVDRSIHFSFRFGKQIQLPNSFVAVIPDGRYWLNASQTRSATISSDNCLLGDLSPESPILEPGHPEQHPSKHSILSLDYLPKAYRINGTVAILSGLLNDVYFHWMFDILPRFELLKRSGLDLSAIDFFVIDNKTQFQQESLEIFKIPKSKVLNISQTSHIQATQLIAPSFPGSIAWMPPWTCNFLRHHFLTSENSYLSHVNRRIYISRGNAKSRRVLNEDEVIQLLEKLGFVSVTLESMSVVEQASILGNASVVIAPHGSGLTNLAFCQPGTKVIEIFSPNYVYHCYWLVSNSIDLEYYYLLGETLPGFYLQKLVYPDERHEDIFVEIGKLRQILEFAKIS